MDEIMTLPEIEARYPGEWILVADPELDEHLRVVRGKVVAHTRDRDEFDSQTLTLRPKSSAHLYTGTIPEDMEFILSPGLA
jgi:hypothetical protein